MNCCGEWKEGKGKDQGDRRGHVADWGGGFGMVSEDNTSNVGIRRVGEVGGMDDPRVIAKKLQAGPDLAPGVAVVAGPDRDGARGAAGCQGLLATDTSSALPQICNDGLRVDDNHDGGYPDENEDDSGGGAFLKAAAAQCASGGDADMARSDESEGTAGMEKGEEMDKENREVEKISIPPSEEMARPPMSSTVSISPLAETPAGANVADGGFRGFDLARPVRQSFSQASGVDADLLLARVLQEQERAYLLLTGFGAHGYGSESEELLGGVFDDGNLLHLGRAENDARVEGDGDGPAAGEDDGGTGSQGRPGQGAHSEGNAQEPLDQRTRESMEIDGTRYDDDESLARALQEEEDREMTARLMALACSLPESPEDSEDEGLQDVWAQEYDPDNFSYEELVALGDVVGTESRGLPQEVIASLPRSTYGQVRQQSGSGEGDGSSQSTVAEEEQCVVCRLEFEAADTVTVLGCNHVYHSECIQGWLNINKWKT
ncbi:hypothetical protein CBR_g18643 [Chara braunii]|uniref:RING-type domain-containing protein n=1 Tax=Chara braunii TaxID=69332 RepID=A0A388JTD3_CHABU|nr:hypothetical protein CBR_g18643 [Chara braunii]|eukprot:GBG61050.1 hypothetical protein CBR_g18643 [Chara braunii]